MEYLDAGGNIIPGYGYTLPYSASGTHYATWTRQFIQPYFPAAPGAVNAMVSFSVTGSDGASVNYIDDVAIEVY
jgi:hypothetical protein